MIHNERSREFGGSYQDGTLTSKTTSPSLLLKIRNEQDTGAWDQFVEIYAPIVRSYCFQRRIQQADVDDIVQDVMTAIATAIRTFDYDPVKGRFRAWFGTVTANKIKNFLNKQVRINDTHGELDPMDSNRSYTDPDSDWIDIFSERILRAACARIRLEFEETTWACFDAIWMRDESAAQTAKALSIPINRAYVNKFRVLRRLESEVKMLAEDMPIDGGRTK